MLTTDDLAAVPLLAGLPPAELTRLASTSADIHLAPDEFLVHEGDPPALFVVIAGKLELSKTMGGVERAIAIRLPGTVYGEVPMVFGTQMQATARAVESSRVLRMEPRQYHALAAASPEFQVAIGNLALERMGGLRGIAEQPPKPQVTVVGNRWDKASHELKRFLSRNQILYEWLTLDDPDLDRLWESDVPAENDCPALRLADGTTLHRPETRTLAAALGLGTIPRARDYDTLIIGAGPAGLAAAVYGASEGLRTLVVECEAPGGQAETSSRIENYLGFPNGISGDELGSRALRQARRLGAEILITRKALRLDPVHRTVRLDGDEVIHATTVIIATGVNWRRLDLDGFDRLIGKGIYYGAARSEAGITQGKDVFLIGAGNSAGQAAIFFANHARNVTLIVRGGSLEKSMSQYLIDQIRAKSNIRVALNSEVAAVIGEDHLTAIDLLDRDAGGTRHEACAGLFVFIGADAETQWLPEAVARDARGFVLTGADLVKSGRWSETRDPYLLETSVPGIFACGDVRFSTVKRVASAVGEGSMAIAFVHQYLRLLREAGGGRPALDRARS
jgi:thioredoxin reductase (NADPH)